MTYDEPENGKMAVVEYDRSPQDLDETRNIELRGVIEQTDSDGMVQLNDEKSARDQTVVVNREKEEGVFLVEKTRGTEERVYDLIEFRVETVSDHLIRSDDLYDSSEKYTDELDDVTGALARANAAIGVVHRESDAEFVSQFDAWTAARVFESSVSERLEEHNESDYDVYDRATIEFPDEASALLWVEEICGQISDGAWENQVRDWEQYYGAEVLVNEDIDEVNVVGDLPALDFEEELNKYEGLPGRMIFYAIASGVEEDFTREDVREVCRSLENAMTGAPRPPSY